jgi:hypothetical protein
MVLSPSSRDEHPPLAGAFIRRANAVPAHGQSSLLMIGKP